MSIFALVFISCFADALSGLEQCVHLFLPHFPLVFVAWQILQRSILAREEEAGKQFRTKTPFSCFAFGLALELMHNIWDLFVCVNNAPVAFSLKGMKDVPFQPKRR